MATQDLQRNWISKWISASFGNETKSDFEVFKLLGDGSTRSFFRVFFQNLPNLKSAILLWDPEWTLSQDYPAHQNFLDSKGIPVPQFFKSDPKEGVLLMEDLGDDLLQNFIQKNPDKKILEIEKAVILLAEMQGKTFPVPITLPCTTRYFDHDKYLQEMSFTLDHLSEKFLKQKKATDLTAASQFCRQLEKIGPRCFSHRDYHTRNILPNENKLVLIDFQDARMGPPHYDLASILYDAYLPVCPKEREALIATYQNALKKYPISSHVNWDTFEIDLKSVALQRTLKAAGSFASFFTRHQKTTHLPYLIPALEMALALRKNLTSLPKDFDMIFPIESWIQNARSREKN